MVGPLSWVLSIPWRLAALFVPATSGLGLRATFGDLVRPGGTLFGVVLDEARDWTPPVTAAMAMEGGCLCVTNHSSSWLTIIDPAQTPLLRRWRSAQNPRVRPWKLPHSNFRS